MLDLTAMSRRRCRRGAVRRRESDEHAILARTQGIPTTVGAASETEGTSEADNWQNTVVDGSSPIRTPADLVGKTLALTAATRNIRLPTWSPLIDRVQLLQLARYMKKYDVISTLPNFTKLVPSFVEGGRTLQATVGESGFLTLRLDGKLVSKLRAGNYTVAIADKSTKDNFHLQGAGFSRSTSVAKKETATWTVALKKGVYQYSSYGSSKRKGSFRVT